MGWWRSEHGTIGDWPSDILSRAFNQIEEIYMHECGRLPTQGEVADLIEFCSMGVFRPQCGDVNYSFTDLDDDDTPRAVERGQQGALRSVPPAGKLVNINPVTGENYSLKDVDQVVEEQIKEGGKRKEYEQEKENNMTNKEGLWPEDSLQRAFVEGAEYWQWKQNNATMFPCERDIVEEEAVKRYGNPLPEALQKCDISYIENKIYFSCKPEEIEKVFNYLLPKFPEPCEVYRDSKTVWVKIVDEKVREHFLKQVTEQYHD